MCLLSDLLPLMLLTTQLLLSDAISIDFESFPDGDSLSSQFSTPNEHTTFLSRVPEIDRWR